MSQAQFSDSIAQPNTARSLSSGNRLAWLRMLLLGALGASLILYAAVVLFGPILRGTDTYITFSRLYIWTAALKGGDPMSVWTPIDANGFGSPVSFFYHKLFNLVGAVFVLASGDIVAGFRVAVLAFSALMFAGIYVCAGRFGADRTSRVAIATLALFSPYLITRLVEAGNLAEYAATALVPFVIALAIDIYAGRFGKWRALALFALLLLLALAHILVFVVVSGVLLLAMLYLFVTAPRRGGLPLAVTLGALVVFFTVLYVPFTFWSTYFCPAQANIFGHIADNLLSPGYLFWRSPRSQFGWPVFVLMVGLALQLRQRDTPRARTVLALGSIALAVILLMTRLTRPLWEVSAQLDFVQYPWRLLTLVIPLCLVAIAGMLEQLSVRVKAFVQLGLLGIALTNAAAMLYLYQHEFAPIPAAQLRREVPTTSIVGPDAGGEYFPAAFQTRLDQINVLNVHAPSVLPAPAGLIEASACTYPDIPRPAYFKTLHLSVACASGGHVRINQFSTPFLQSLATNGQGVSVKPMAGSQLIDFALPAGNWTITVKQRSYADLVIMAWRHKLFGEQP